MRRSMTSFLTGLREVWVLSKPYFSSEERWFGRLMLLTIIALNLLMVGMNLILNFWNRDFFNAIQAYDVKTVTRLLFLYDVPPGGLPMPGFVEIVTVYVLVAVYAFYLNQMLQIRWRQWMTRQYVDNWLADRAYYNISLSNVSAIGMDNPDQRISEDMRDFTLNTLSLGLDFISNVVTLFSFVFVLYAVSGSITLFGITIPGYMLWVAVIYSVIGTVLTHLIGRKLINLSFNQQKVEADFRYNLIRVRENPEAIALYHGESDERMSLRERFEAVRENFWAIMRRTKALNFFTVSFAQVAGIFPLVVALPRFFAHKIGLGGLTQIQDAFGQVQNALSWFINSYQNLVTYRATVSRLHGFTEAVSAARIASLAGPQLQQCRQRAELPEPHPEPAGRPQADQQCQPDLAARPARGAHRPIRGRQIDLVPGDRRHLAVRRGQHHPAQRQRAVPAAKTLFPARQPEAHRRLSGRGDGDRR